MYVEDIETNCFIPQEIAEHMFNEENIHSIEYFFDDGKKIAARAIGCKYNYNGDKISDVTSPWLKL